MVKIRVGHVSLNKQFFWPNYFMISNVTKTLTVFRILRTAYVTQPQILLNYADSCIEALDGNNPGKLLELPLGGVCLERDTD